MKPLHWYAGTVLIGLGDGIQALGEGVVEVGWLVRQAGALQKSMAPHVRRPKRVPPRHPMYASNGELDAQL